jgi:hypothetical protein
VSRPRTTGAEIEPCTGAELGQSSAAHTNSGATTSPPVHASGIHGTAYRPSPTGPQNRHSASAGSRSGPQPKQVGKGWSWCQANWAEAAIASSAPTGAGASSSSAAGRAASTTSSPSCRSIPPPAGAASSGVSSGGGRRSVTSAAGTSSSAAARPAE